VFDGQEFSRFVVETFAKMGAEVRLTSDLVGYRRGQQLTMGELRKLEDGAVVWAHYRKGDSDKVNGPYRITKNRMIHDDSWGLEDGSSFACDFSPGCLSDTALAEEEHDWGPMRLFRALR